MIRLILVALLTLTSAAHAANVCQSGNDAFKKLHLAPNAEGQRQLNHHWMALAKAAAPKWSQAKLDSLLIPGTHDAGTFGTPTTTIGVFADRRPNWAVTQSHSFLDQLCLGARWFDVRLERINNEWRIFHSFYRFGTGASTLEQFARFIEDPAHADEFAFVRLKLSAKPAEKAALYKEWTARLGAHLVDKTKLPRASKAFSGFAWLTPADIKKAGTGKGGRIFLLEYEEKGTNVPAELRKNFFSYTTDQAGTFSNEVPLATVNTKQTAKLKEFKSQQTTKGKASEMSGKAFGLWWTSTGSPPNMDVKKNTAAFWPSSKPSPATPLEAFYAVNGCTVGTFLIVDFFGDTALLGQKTNLVMDLAFDHNVKTLNGLKPKLCAAPLVAQGGDKGNAVQAKGKGK